MDLGRLRPLVLLRLQARRRRLQRLRQHRGQVRLELRHPWSDGTTHLLFEPVELLEAARECLSPDGVLAVSTPNQQSVLDVIAGGLYRASGGLIKGPLEKFYIEQHFVYFSPTTLEDAFNRAGLRLLSLRRELTDLRRLSLSPPMRLVLKSLFAGARLTGLENRLFAVACRA